MKNIYLLDIEEPKRIQIQNIDLQKSNQYKIVDLIDIMLLIDQI